MDFYILYVIYVQQTFFPPPWVIKFKADNLFYWFSSSHGTWSRYPRLSCKLSSPYMPFMLSLCVIQYIEHIALACRDFHTADDKLVSAVYFCVPVCAVLVSQSWLTHCWAWPVWGVVHGLCWYSTGHHYGRK